MIISQRTLRFGPYTLLAKDSESEGIPYFLAGRRMYNVGMASGSLQPIGAEHLVGEMGGIWAHPVKVADGLSLLVTDADGTQPMAHSFEVIELMSHIEWRYRLGGLLVKRRDFVVEDQTAYVSMLTLRNEGARPKSGRLHLGVWLKFLGNWFGGTSTGGGEYWHEDGVVLGYDRYWQGRWGVACGSTIAPEQCSIQERSVGRVATLTYPFDLGPGKTQTWEFLLTADNQRGHEGARHLFHNLIGRGERLLTEKVDGYHQTMFTGVALQTPDNGVNRSFGLAKANLQLLSADYTPHVPPYFLAGVPEYPQLFGCDTEYTIPGAVAGGFAEMSKSALLALAEYGARSCGRIPHEVTTNGRVFHPGNTQETPQFAIACWDYFRWTGDMPFLRHVYPICREGIMEYMPAIWSGGPGIPYPVGDAMVERHGMGPYKLDSVCYLFQSLGALRSMARTLDQPDDARRYDLRMQDLQRRFESDWWIEAESMYADSLNEDMSPKLDGHWTVVLPLLVGLASEERARRALERIEAEWVNEWGLVHTRKKEELVWTLPTGLLALTAFRYGRADLGVRLLGNIAETANYGTLGAFKELIPIGLCFVQLWSAGLYIQGIIEGVLGLEPMAHQHRLSVRPNLPGGWPQARLNELLVGAHTLSIEVSPTSMELKHSAGPEPLELRYGLPSDAGALDAAALETGRVREESDAAGRWLVAMLEPGQQLGVRVSAERVEIDVPEPSAETVLN